MSRISSIIVLIVVLALAAPAFAATGCIDEVTGEPGLPSIDGCITPAEYDEMFSYENLSTVPSLSPLYETVAEAYNITPESPVARDRLIGVGLVEVPFTFKDAVRQAAGVWLG